MIYPPKRPAPVPVPPSKEMKTLLNYTLYLESKLQESETNSKLLNKRVFQLERILDKKINADLLNRVQELQNENQNLRRRVAEEVMENHRLEQPKKLIDYLEGLESTRAQRITDIVEGLEHEREELKATNLVLEADCIRLRRIIEAGEKQWMTSKKETGALQANLLQMLENPEERDTQISKFQQENQDRQVQAMTERVTLLEKELEEERMDKVLMLEHIEELEDHTDKRDGRSTADISKLATTIHQCKSDSSRNPIDRVKQINSMLENHI